MKKIIMIVLYIFFIFNLTGCFGLGSINNRVYSGEYVDLNTETANSILGLSYPALRTIVVLDEDSFGRKLFACYSESIITNTMEDDTVGICGILISQKTDNYEGYVYYYPDYNFIVYAGTSDIMIPTIGDGLMKFAQDVDVVDDIMHLKQKNDWGMTFDEKKCIKEKISQRDKDYEAQLSNQPLVSEEASDTAYNIIIPQAASYRHSYLTSDEYSRHIYFFNGLDVNDAYINSYVVIFNSDGSFDNASGVMEMTNIWKYQDDLKRFKERNGWNTSPL